MNDIKETIKQIKKIQAFQRQIAFYPEAFGIEISPIGSVMLRLIYLCGPLSADGISDIICGILTSRQITDALESLCEAGYLWIERGFYALSRKSVGITLPKDCGKGFAKMPISKSSEETYRLKGKILGQTARSYKIDFDKEPSYNLQVLIATLARKKTTLTRHGTENIFTALEQYKQRYPYLSAMERYDKATARKTEISGHFAAVSTKLKSLTEDSLEKDEILSLYSEYENYLQKLDAGILLLENSALIMPTSGEDDIPDMKMITLKSLSENGVYIQNIAKDRLRLVYSVLDNAPQAMGAGLLFTRLSLPQTLNAKLDIFDPIYRIYTKDKAKMSKTLAGVFDKGKDYSAYFLPLETQIEIVEV